MTSIGQHEAVAQSRLLQLPGELRNRIYECATESCSISIAPPAIPRCKISMPHNAPAKPPNWSSLKRQTLGLTQACRQLRKEALPFLQRQTTVTIHGKDAERYESDFDLGSGKTAGKLIVYFDGFGSKVNMLVLIYLSAISPALSIEFPDWPEEVNALFDIGKNPTWKGYVLKSVSGLVFKNKRWGPRLHIEVEADAAEPWMFMNGVERPAYWYGDLDEYVIKVSDWIRRVGLATGGFTSMDVEFTVASPD